MKILGVLLAFVGFALGIYEIINTLRGKENKRILCGVAIAYLGYGVCYSVSQKDLGYIGVAFLFGLIFYAIRVMCVLLRMAAKREKRSLKNDLIVLAVLLVGFIAGMMLPYDKEEEAKRTALLTDGELGDYGKEATTKSGYKYVRYTVPAGNYTVENKAKQSAVFVVPDSNSDDVSASLQLSSNGEKARLTVKDGYHIELSMYAQVLLIPEQ